MCGHRRARSARAPARARPPPWCRSPSRARARTRTGTPAASVPTGPAPIDGTNAPSTPTSIRRRARRRAPTRARYTGGSSASTTGAPSPSSAGQCIRIPGLCTLVPSGRNTCGLPRTSLSSRSTARQLSITSRRATPWSISEREPLHIEVAAPGDVQDLVAQRDAATAAEERPTQSQVETLRGPGVLPAGRLHRFERGQGRHRPLPLGRGPCLPAGTGLDLAQDGDLRRERRPGRRPPVDQLQRERSVVEQEVVLEAELATSVMQAVHRDVGPGTADVGPDGDHRTAHERDGTHDGHGRRSIRRGRDVCTPRQGAKPSIGSVAVRTADDGATPDPSLLQAREHFERREWRAAAEALAAVAPDRLPAADGERLAVAAGLVGDDDRSADAWARAAEAHLRAGDQLGVGPLRLLARPRPHVAAAMSLPPTAGSPGPATCPATPSTPPSRACCWSWRASSCWAPTRPPRSACSSASGTSASAAAMPTSSPSGTWVAGRR